MEALFLKLLSMSLSASWLVLAVLALRVVLRKAPKWTRCLLWALVAVRLMCPFTVESPLSLLPEISLDERIAGVLDDYAGITRVYWDDTGNERTQRHFDDAVAAGREPITADTDAPYVVTGADGVSAPRTVGDMLSRVWLAGVAAMLLHALVSWLRLRRRVAASLPLWDNILICDDIDAPFILGMLRPCVYLPSTLAEPQLSYVVAHEEAHLARHDHWWKPLGYLLLAVYWFNPLLWLSYVLLCRDIELACDERVVRNMAPAERADYSQALLDQSRLRRASAACPLAFGEVGVRERVKAVLRYKKPAFWVVAGTVVVCAAVAVCFLTNPESGKWLENDAAVLAYVMEHYDVDGEEIVSGKYEMAGVDVSGQGYKSFTVYTADGDEYWLQANGVWRKALFGYRFGPAMKVTDVTYRLLRRGDEHMVVYDDAAGLSYELSNRPYHDYDLYAHDRTLYVVEQERDTGKVHVGVPVIEDGDLHFRYLGEQGRSPDEAMM